MDYFQIDIIITIYIVFLICSLIRNFEGSYLLKDFFCIWYESGEKKDLIEWPYKLRLLLILFFFVFPPIFLLCTVIGSPILFFIFIYKQIVSFIKLLDWRI